MRDGSIVGEVFFVKIVFLEKRNDRTRFELIRKGTRDERKVYDVSQVCYFTLAHARETAAADSMGWD